MSHTSAARAASVISDFAMSTDGGPVRPANEDAAIAAPPVFLVADGMGGHGSGDRASAAALGPFQSLVGGAPPQPQSVFDAIGQAALDVAALAPEAASDRAPGSTLSGLVLVEHSGQLAWLVVNLGDSRTYRLHHGRLVQRTEDHSEVQEMLRAGELTPSQAAHHPRRNIVTRALGHGMPSLPDYELAPVTPSERWLVCSDGLSGALSPTQLTAVLSDGADALMTSRLLVTEAIAAGGLDNVTAIVVDVAADAPASVIDDDTVPRSGQGAS